MKADVFCGCPCGKLLAHGAAAVDLEPCCPDHLRGLEPLVLLETNHRAITTELVKTLPAGIATPGRELLFAFKSDLALTFEPNGETS